MSQTPEALPLGGPVRGSLPPTDEWEERENQDGLGLVAGVRSDFTMYQDLLVRGKVSENVFRRICELFPNLLRDVLEEGSAPLLSPTNRHSQKEGAFQRDGKSEDSDLQGSFHSKTASNPENCLQKKVVGVNSNIGVGLAAQRTDSDVELKADSSTGISDVCEDGDNVHPVTTLRDLFCEDGDFVSAKGSPSKSLLASMEYSKNAQNCKAWEEGGAQPLLSSESMQTGFLSPGSAKSKHNNGADEYGPPIVYESMSQSRSCASLDSKQDQFTFDQGGTNLSSAAREVQTAPGVNPLRPPLRRPIASRRKGVVNIPLLQRNDTASQQETERSPRVKDSRVDTSDEKTETTHMEQAQASISETPKGVIVRGFADYKEVRGIRRAEIGQIMSWDQLNSATAPNLSRNLIPKSLKPALFLDDCDDSPSLMPSSFQYVAEKSNPGGVVPLDSPARRKLGKKIESLFPLSPAHRDEGKSTKLRNLFKLTPMKDEKEPTRSGKSLLAFTPVKRGEGANSGGGLRNLFPLSPSAQTDPTREGQSTKSNFLEAGDSSGVLNRLGHKLRRGPHGKYRKQATDAPPDGKICTIVRPGSIHETVCKICVVCRNTLGYEVHVKDNGKKIKVQSKDGEDVEHFRATIQIRELHDTYMRCSVHVRPSRSDEMRTGTGALWKFYQALESEL